MSFLDDRDDSPSRRPPRPSAGSGPPTDRQTLMMRRAIAAAAAVLFLIVLVLLVRGCMSARQERAFKDYVRDATALQQESAGQSRALFDLLRDPGDQSAVDLRNRINAFRNQAEQLVDRADGTDRPGELNSAHDYLVETLGFRRDGLEAIATALPTALGDEGRGQATRRIAAQMQNFLASDVVYSQRFVPRLQEGLRDEELLDDVPLPQELTGPRTGFLPDIEWLRPDTVTDRISRIRGGGAGRAATPGLHGTGLGVITVNPGGATLAEGQTADLKASDDLSFDVEIQNQGENEERDVTVRVAITGAGRAIRLEERLDTIDQGENKKVSIPLADRVPTGRPVTLEFEVRPVPGEKKVDNNKAEFPAIFSE